MQSRTFNVQYRLCYFYRWWRPRGELTTAGLLGHKVTTDTQLTAKTPNDMGLGNSLTIELNISCSGISSVRTMECDQFALCLT